MCNIGNCQTAVNCLLQPISVQTYCLRIYYILTLIYFQLNSSVTINLSHVCTCQIFISNKKAFQLKANHLFADSYLGYIVNKFEQVRKVPRKWTNLKKSMGAGAGGWDQAGEGGVAGCFDARSGEGSMWVWGQGHGQLSSHVNKFEQVYGGRIGTPLWTNRQTHMTKNITYPYFVASCNKSIASVVSSENLPQDVWTPNPFSHTCLNLFNLAHPDNLNSLSVRAECPSWCLKIDVFTVFHFALRLHSKSDISASWAHIVRVTCKKQRVTSIFIFADSELHNFVR